MSSVDLMTRIYRCPETHQALHELDAARVDALNEAVRAGALTNHGGQTVQQIIDGGLATADESFVYPVRDGVPNLLPAERVALADLAG